MTYEATAPSVRDRTGRNPKPDVAKSVRKAPTKTADPKQTLKATLKEHKMNIKLAKAEIKKYHQDIKMYKLMQKQARLVYKITK